jgi:DNA-directed RNA polymerase subunit M
MSKWVSNTSTFHPERKQTFQTETAARSVDQNSLQNRENPKTAGRHPFVMIFCPKCGALLEVVPGKSAELHCRKCKYNTKATQRRISEKKISVANSIHREIAVLDVENSNLRIFPVVHAVCSECRNSTSETWTLAIGSEGTTGVTFLRCTNCGHTRREAE